MDKQTEVVVKKYLKKIKEQKLLSKINKVILFGSRSRSDWQKDSDIDLFILLNEEKKDIKKKLIDLAYDIDLEEDVLLNPAIYSRRQSSYKDFQQLPFYRNVLKDGFILYATN
jgi:predicted nucleotidyltransferase